MDDGNEIVDANSIITPGRKSALHPCGAQIQSQHFESARQTLLSVFELSQSYKNVLQDGGSLGRYFNVPLVSDILADRVVCLFSEVRPNVLQLRMMVTVMILTGLMWLANAPLVENVGTGSTKFAFAREARLYGSLNSTTT